MFVIKKYIIFIGLLLCTLGRSQRYSSGKGTLTFTYHTDENSQRLDRIHFWLVNANGERRLYPNHEKFILDRTQKRRMVVIEEIASGDYTIEFLVPNADQFFEEVPNRFITIPKGGVKRVNQEIRTNFQIRMNKLPSPAMISSTKDRLAKLSFQKQASDFTLTPPIIPIPSLPRFKIPFQKLLY